LVFRQIVAPVQPGHALGAALVEGHSECLFAGLVTTALTGKIATPEIRRAKNSVPHRSIRNTTPRRTSRFGKPSAVKGRISLPLSFSRSSHASAGRVAPALTFRRRAITAAPAHNLPRLQRRQQTV
jgi:hypothetical protein